MTRLESVLVWLAIGAGAALAQTATTFTSGTIISSSAVNSAFGGKQDVLPSGTSGQALVSTGSAWAAAAVTNSVAGRTGAVTLTASDVAGVATTNVLSRALQVNWPSDTTVTAATITPMLYAPWSGTITKVAYATGGTGTPSFVADVAINGMPVTGCSSLTVNSSTVTLATCTAANTFSLGDKVTVTTSSISGSPADASVEPLVSWTN